MRYAPPLLTALAAFTALVALVSPAPAAGTASSSSEERSLLAEMNRVRAAHDLAPLRFDKRLQRAARAHSLTMLRTGVFTHGDFASRVRRFRARGPVIAENLAWGAGRFSEPQEIVGGWLASPAHRANLLRPGFRRVGVGAVTGAFAGFDDALVVTADFAGK